MIEVEKKFRPTEEQLALLLKDAEFLGEKENADTYYDLPDFSFWKKGMRLRKRNNGYELKIQGKDFYKNITEHNEEIDDHTLILERIGFNKNDNLEDIVKNKSEVLCVIKTKRKKYKKGEFAIDIDETDFGYNVVEIELIVENEQAISQAEQKIINLAERFNFSTDRLPGKVSECLRLTRPEVYKELKGHVI